LRTTGNKFGAEIVIENNKGEILKKFSLPEKDGFSSEYIGQVTIPSMNDFPVKIVSDIKCSTDFSVVRASQVALGSKSANGKQSPICYQATVFCNDNLPDRNRDHDLNDLVLTWQLYNSSTD